MLSSETERGRLATETPIKSADSWRVETDERRRWCELRLEEGTGERLAGAPGWPGKVDETGETSPERAGREKEEEMEWFRERERT